MRVSGWLFLFQQTAGSFFLLAAVARCMHVRLSLLRMAAVSACCGGIVIAACTAGTTWQTALAAACLTVAPRLSGLRMPHPGRLRMALVMFFLTCCCAGFLRALSAAVPPLPLPLCAAATLLLPALDRRIPAPSCATVAISLSGQHVRLTALMDSGNLLRDPLTALPVIVCSRRALAPLDPMRSRLRLISVRTAAGSTLMPIFRADSVHLLTDGAWHDASALIGIAPESYDGFQALVPASLAASPGAPSAAISS